MFGRRDEEKFFDPTESSDSLHSDDLEVTLYVIIILCLAIAVGLAFFHLP